MKKYRFYHLRPDGKKLYHWDSFGAVNANKLHAKSYELENPDEQLQRVRQNFEHLFGTIPSYEHLDCFGGLTVAQITTHYEEIEE